MRLWMICPIKVYEVLESRGRLTADGRRIDPSVQMQDAYSWMAEQMRRRVGPPPPGVTYPLWAWARWERIDRAKPDLRSVRHMEGPGKHVRLELEVPVSRVLLSDFEAWHAVLNNWYLSWSEAEDDAFHKRHETSSKASYRAEIIESWDRIFDIEGGDPAWRGKPADRSVQATFWHLTWDEVVDVTTFEGTANKDV